MKSLTIRRGQLLSGREVSFRATMVRAKMGVANTPVQSGRETYSQVQPDGNIRQTAVEPGQLYEAVIGTCSRL